MDTAAPAPAPAPIPAWQLYGERAAFPDLCHVERIADRAAGHDWTIAPHRHLHLHQIFVLTAGHADLTVDGKPLPLTLPAAINLPPGTAHGFCFSAGTEGFVLTLPVQSFPDLLGPGAELAAPLARPFALPAETGDAAMLDALSAEHAARAPFRATRLRALVLGVAVALARRAGPPAGTPRGDPRVQRFAAQVTAHLRDRWSVADHARALNLSPRHLSRLARAETGLSAQGVIEAAAMAEACRLLVYTRMTAASVGYATGFDDPAYFSRAFRRHTGLSPTAYRARFDG